MLKSLDLFKVSKLTIKFLFIFFFFYSFYHNLTIFSYCIELFLSSTYIFRLSYLKNVQENITRRSNIMKSDSNQIIEIRWLKCLVDEKNQCSWWWQYTLPYAIIVYEKKKKRFKRAKYPSSLCNKCGEIRIVQNVGLQISIINIFLTKNNYIIAFWKILESS